MEVQVDHKCDNFCWFAKKISNGMSGPCPTLTFTKTYGSELFFIKQKKEPYKDHLCLFRALAMYMNGHNDLDSHTSR